MAVRKQRRAKSKAEEVALPLPDSSNHMWVDENTSRILKGRDGLRGSQWPNPVDYYVRLADRALTGEAPEDAPPRTVPPPHGER